jgi:SNF2 family DNA or RNA helicase
VSSVASRPPTFATKLKTMSEEVQMEVDPPIEPAFKLSEEEQVDVEGEQVQGEGDEEEDEQVVEDEVPLWTSDETEALVDYVAKYGLASWDKLSQDPILSVRHNSAYECARQFDLLFAVTDEDLEYHFPLLEPPPRKTYFDEDEEEEEEEGEEEEGEEDGEKVAGSAENEGAETPVETKDNDSEANQDEQSDEPEDDDDSDYGGPRKRKGGKTGGKKDNDDDEFVLDDDHESEDEDDDDDDEDDEAHEEDDEFDDDPLVNPKAIQLEFDEELEYHPHAYYPDIFKRPRRLGVIIRPPRPVFSMYDTIVTDPYAIGKKSGRASQKKSAEEEEEYRPRGTRSSARLRDSKKISYKYEEKEEEFDDMVSASSGEEVAAPGEKIDKVLATRSVTRKFIEEEELKQKVTQKLADKEVIEQHPENVVPVESKDEEEDIDIDEARQILHRRIENKVDLLHAKNKEKIQQYLIKPEGVSYKHCEWLSYQDIYERFGEPGTAKINRFTSKRKEIEEENESLWGGEPFNPEFVEVERVIARSIFEVEVDSHMKSVIKYLVKWSSLSYTECTWETAEIIDDQAKIAEFYRFNTPPAAIEQAEKVRPDPAKFAQWFDKSPSFFKNGNTLRDYQLDGLNWLIQCFYLRRNPILADEMGLGKTVQSISYLYFMVQEHKINGPFLVVVPLSTLQHWKREIQEWTEMNVILYYEPQNGKVNRALIRQYEFYYPGTQKVKFHVLLTTYETVIADIEDLGSIAWEQVIIDEGHRLKNKNTKLLKCLQKMNIKRRMLLTGTPIQNNTEELWTLLNYVEPEQFFSVEEFMSRFGNLTDPAQVDELQKEIRPYVLRRMKENVEKSIPPKEETIIDIELTTLQKQYYRAIYEKNRDFLYKGVEKANLPSLMNIEMELRKCCNHPWLVKGVEEKAFPREVTQDEYFRVTVEASGKLVLLDKLLPKLYSEGHRVLIFSQMKKVLDILEEYVEYKKYEFERLDGSSQGNVRQAAIDRFSRKGSKKFVFLLSTRAGGVGLNLTAADTVIIFDSDWNPQQDIQAQARVHRIGQQKSVMIYRLVTRNTYEAEMFERASRKLGLEQAVMSQIQVQTPGAAKPDREELNRLLKLGAYGLMDDDDSASKKFSDSSIDDILRHGTRVVKHNEEGGTGGGLGSINFSKMTFASAGADTSIDLNDPLFWEKVLKGNEEANQEVDISELSISMADGSAMKTGRSRKEFMTQMKTKTQQVLKKVRAGKDHPDLDDVLALLKTLISSAKFIDSEKVTAKAWIKDLQRGSRRRGLDSIEEDEEEEEEVIYAKPRRRGGAASDEDDFEEEEEASAEGSGAESYEDESGPRKTRYSCIRKGAITNKMVPKGELCGVCNQRGQLIECDGPCLRAYHPSCVEVDEKKIPSSKEHWSCPSCEEKTYKCLICKEPGMLDEDEGVLRCSQSGCSAFYHYNCIKELDLAQILNESAGKFRCPRHTCVICEETGSNVYCEFCTSSYHSACFPGSSEYARLNSRSIICPKCLPKQKSSTYGEGVLSSASLGKIETKLLRARNESSKKVRKGKKKKFVPGVYTVSIKSSGEELVLSEEVPVFVDMVVKVVRFTLDGDFCHEAEDVEYGKLRSESTVDESTKSEDAQKEGATVSDNDNEESVDQAENENTESAVVTEDQEDTEMGVEEENDESGDADEQQQQQQQEEEQDSSSDNDDEFNDRGSKRQRTE